MRSIAWLFTGLFIVALALGAPRVQADDLNLTQGGRGKNRAAKAENTGNSDRGVKEFGFFLEPAVGFSYGKFSGPLTSTDTTNTEATLTGPAFAGLFGAVWKSYFLALRADYQMVSGSGLSMKDFSLGAELGMTLSGSPIRFFGAFNFIDDLDNAGRKFSANSFILGASYYFTRSLVANFQYHIRDFGRVTQGGQSLDPSFSNFALTISLPLMFGTRSMPDLARSSSEGLGKEMGGSMGEWNL